MTKSKVTTRVRRLASIGALTVAVTGVGLAVMPAAQAGLPAAPADLPAAYTITSPDEGDTCQLASVDLATGAIDDLPASSSADACALDLAVAPDGAVWGLTGADVAAATARLVRFDPATGALVSNTVLTGDFTDSAVASGGLAFDATGTLFAQVVTDQPGCDFGFVCLYTVDPATGASTFVGNPGPDFGETRLEFLASDCGTSLLTVIPETLGGAQVGDATWGEPGDPSVDAFPPDHLGSYDKSSGALSDVATFATTPPQVVAGIDYTRPDGLLYALVGDFSAPLATTDAAPDATTEATTDATSAGDVHASIFNIALYLVDPATGGLTLVGTADPTFNVAGLAIAGSCAAPPVIVQPTFTG